MNGTLLSKDIYIECIQHYEEVKNHSHVVGNSIPIPFFGDIKEYLNSDMKIVTAALNPSDVEFQNDASRFNICKSLAEPCELEDSLKNYFQFNPYDKWFRYFEGVLNGLGASYGGKMLSYEMQQNKYSTALHLDVCSPIATKPTWSKLSREQRGVLINKGKTIFKKLVNELKPDVIIASVGWSHLRDWSEDFSVGREWPSLIEYNTDKHGNVINSPLKVQSKLITLGGEHKFLFINGQAANTPFGKFSNQRKKEVGLAIKDELNLINK